MISFRNVVLWIRWMVQYWQSMRKKRNDCCRKALYKIADVSALYPRAYISGAQLSQVKLNQSVTVSVDDGEKSSSNTPELLPGSATKRNLLKDYPDKRRTFQHGVCYQSKVKKWWCPENRYVWWSWNFSEKIHRAIIILNYTFSFPAIWMVWLKI